MIGKQATIVCVAIASGSVSALTSPPAGRPHQQDAATSSRRAFLSRVPIVAAGSGAAFLLNVDHETNCGCVSCQLGISPASAYERRDVGGSDRSAATAAMNDQAYQTNNRLEQSGFKLDTREEEQARLSSALSSFSYDSTASSGKKTGYNKTSPKSDSKK
jgi:hypothetical protein